MKTVSLKLKRLMLQYSLSERIVSILGLDRMQFRLGRGRTRHKNFSRAYLSLTSATHAAYLGTEIHLTAQGATDSLSTN